MAIGIRPRSKSVACASAAKPVLRRFARALATTIFCAIVHGFAVFAVPADELSGEPSVAPDLELELGRRLDAIDELHRAGRFRDVLESVREALLFAGSRPEAARQDVASLHLAAANAWLALGPLENADRELDLALERIRSSEAFALEAAIRLTRGNLAAATGRAERAIDSLEAAAELAREAGLAELQVTALANAARVATRDSTAFERASANLARAYPLLDSVSPGLASVDLRISLAYSDLLLLQGGVADPDGGRLGRAHGALLRARSDAELFSARRISADCDGLLGTLYELEERWDESLFLTRRALGAIDPTAAPEARARWLWQEGRVLRALGRTALAEAALRDAVDLLEEIRPRLSRSYAAGVNAFRDQVGPVFYELADLLLSQSRDIDGEERQRRRLREARSVVERLRAAELRDYFRDDCVDLVRNRITSLDEVEGGVVVYPVSLGDRLELIVSTGSELSRVRVDVSAEEFEATVREFRSRLTDALSRSYVRPARRLYDWIVRPIESVIGDKTLVLVPQGILLTVPIAALHDGTRHLFERFPSTMSPGLELTDPTPHDPSRMRMVLTGVSKAVQGFEALPSVAEELASIAEIHPAKVLLDEAFNESNLVEAMSDPEVNVVHIASHGILAPDVQESFILTWDESLDFRELDSYLDRLSLRQQPLDLLTLSACETAAGDERAALGLAGVAVKAGARSALGSLWRVDDRASAMLMVEFYRQLKKPGVTKAIALQRAQRAVAQDPEFGHPIHWAAFILVSSWL